MSKIFTFASSVPLPVYNGALSFHYSLRIVKMAKSFRRVYVSNRNATNIYSHSVVESYRSV